MRYPSPVLALALLVPLAGIAGEATGGPPTDAVPTAFEHVPPADAAFLEAARAASVVYQQHLAALRARLGHEEEAERLAAMRFMAQLADRSLIQDLLPFLDPTLHSTRELAAAIVALADIGSVEVVDAFRRLSGHKERAVREAVVYGLARMEALGINDFRANLGEPTRVIKANGAVGIGLERDTETGHLLALALYQDDRPFIRQRAAIALGELGDPTHGPALATALTDPNPRVRRLAAEALVRLNYKPAIPKLIMALEANVAGIHINRCLIRLVGEDLGYNPLAGAVERMQGIQRYFDWWTEHAEEFGG